MDPKYFFAYYHRIQAYIELRQLDQAQADIDKVRQMGGYIDPSVTEKIQKAYAADPPAPDR